jgi:hypothetical protein
MCVGYVVAWRWPLVGGVISLVCIVTFVIAQRDADMAVVVSILGIPGILFVVYGLFSRRLGAGEASD